MMPSPVIDQAAVRDPGLARVRAPWRLVEPTVQVPVVACCRLWDKASSKATSYMTFTARAQCWRNIYITGVLPGVSVSGVSTHTQ